MPNKKDENLLDAINKNNGLLTLVTLIVALVFMFARVDATLLGIEKMQEDTKVEQKEDKKILLALKESAKDNNREHRDFRRQLKDNNELMRKVVKLLERMADKEKIK